MKKNSEFINYHPVVSFIYFVAVIGFSMFLMNPICLVISLISAFVYSLVINGKGTLKLGVYGILPMMIVAALANSFFNHQGMTIIAYFPNGNPLTLEAIIYGILAATMIGAVIFWFSCYNTIVTEDKLIYLFGKVIPAMSLVISMTMRFVPRFKTHLKQVVDAQKGIGRDVSKGKALKRIKMVMSVLSIMTSWIMENSLETAASMKARGYGIRGRTAFSLFKFTRRDMGMLIFIIGVSAYVLLGIFDGGLKFICFPGFEMAEISVFSASVYAAYFMLCTTPIFIEVRMKYKWNVIESKI